MSVASDYPYLRQRLVEEEARGGAQAHGRQDSAATIKAPVRVASNPTTPMARLTGADCKVDDGKMSSAPLPVPTKENDWLGFCQSAVKLQNGDRRGSLKKRTDYGAAFAASGVTTYYCSAKGCAYQGHVSVDMVWKVVMRDEKLGLKVRWGFLAKSHIKQASVQGRQYQFQCPICIYSYGHAEGRVWKGVDIFMDHVSSHRGMSISFEVAQKLGVIADHVAEDKDEFDLNLYPRDYKHDTSETSSVKSTNPGAPLSRAPTRSSIVDSLWSRKASTAPQTDPGVSLQRTSTWRSDLTRTDSVVEGASIDEGNETEPWSEGLSNFKLDREEDYLSPDF
ncbi:uncharacterized protein LTR77_008823 [Saxophila tyrrhenica]|uniref:Uncharacterized protein n=1 Tax=Saxophila tyrrhenica TaxID=1690608 RepID=A0AAV9P4F8_9PEZI|nr:hypothetical protein LTR77_008823 [Saxophila tyrrhenica]